MYVIQRRFSVTELTPSELAAEAFAASAAKVLLFCEICKFLWLFVGNLGRIKPM